MAGQNHGMIPFLTPGGFVQKGSCLCKQEESHIMYRQNLNLKNWRPGPAKKDSKRYGLQVTCISKQEKKYYKNPKATTKTTCHKVCRVQVKQN